MKRPTRLFTSVLVFLLQGCVSPGQEACHLPFDLIDPEPALNLQMLEDVPTSNVDREARVFKLFQTLGCDELERQPVSVGAGNNVICTVTGATDLEILVGAHHDKAGMSEGVADNWTGIAVLVHLAERYSRQRPVHTLRFVAFAGEERNLRGSRSYVDKLELAGKPFPTSMVNLDTLGISDTRVDSRSNRELKCLAKATAYNSNDLLKTIRLRDISGDWEPFLQAGVRVLGFNAVTARNMGYLHNRGDTRSLVDDVELQSAYGLILNTLDALDHGLDALLMQGLERLE